MKSIKEFLIEEEFVLIGSGLFSKTLIDHYGFPIAEIRAKKETISNTWRLYVISKELFIKDTIWENWIRTVDEFELIYNRNIAIFLFLIDHDFHLDTETRDQLVWKGGLGKEEITMNYRGDFWECCIEDYSGAVVDYCIGVESFGKFKQFLKDHNMLDLFLDNED